MRHLVLCLCLLGALGCSDSTPPPREVTAPKVDASVMKSVLTSASQSGTIGSGMQMLIIGVAASGKETLKKDMADLEKASQAGQKAKVKQIAAKMLKDL